MTRFRWLTNTPFGLPVDPEYKSHSQVIGGNFASRVPHLPGNITQSVSTQTAVIRGSRLRNEHRHLHPSASSGQASILHIRLSSSYLFLGEQNRDLGILQHES